MAYLVVFFCFGYRKLHPFGRINLIIASELTFHTRTAGLYLGRHLIQSEIFLYASLNLFASWRLLTMMDFGSNADRCNRASGLTLNNATYAMPCLH